MKPMMFVTALFAASTAQAAPVTYVIDNSHTYPHFTYNHLGFSNQTHKFDTTRGFVVIDRAAQTGMAEVVIDTKSVNTGHALFNQHIQGADFFDTATYSTMTFIGDKMKFRKGIPVSLTGDLSLKGVTKPVTLAITHFKCMMHPMKKVEACGANASATIKRSAFNMGKYAPLVSDDVTLTLAIEALQEQSMANESK
ncbi:MAG: YceI family protein [Thiobacillus sp.]